MRPVISIPHSVSSIPLRLFLPLFRREMKTRCIHTGRSSLSIFLSFSRSPSLPLLAHLVLLPLPTPFSFLPFIQSWIRSPFHPHYPPFPTLFSDGFSSPLLSQTLEPLLASPYQLFLICYTAIPSPSVLLPTGPHENTYFTGIHDGRRASVRTCLPGYL